MSDEKPQTHEDIERAYHGPRRVILALPDCIESREAKRLVDVAEQLTHQAREKAPPPRS